MIHIISLGAGVQSSTMALMAARGEIGPMPEAAIFADTGAEPAAVMRWLDWLEKQLPFPVHRVMHKQGLLADLMRTDSTRASNPPLFSANGGMLMRKCTGDYKVAVIKRTARQLMAEAGDSSIGQWIGISTDEAHRMKPSGVRYSTHRWPLIEQNMSRGDCLAWMLRNGYPQPPKSACTFCPYHSDETWQAMKDRDPVSFAQAVMVDERIRTGFAGARERLFVHRSRTPLAEAKFDTAKTAGQADMFGDECEGMCGL
jgi:hypothetical protein